MPNYLQTVDIEWFNQRLLKVLVIILLLFAVMLLRLMQLQLIEGEEMRRLSAINSIRLQDIQAPRGVILDRHGNTIVDNRPSFDLHVVLKDAKPLDRTLERLAPLLDETPAQLRERLESARPRGPYTPMLLKSDIGRDTLAAVAANRYALPGVMVQVAARRHYIHDQLAAHVLGYMGEISPEELRRPGFEDCKRGDFIGKFGVERAFETILRGKRGGRQVEVNASGQVVGVLQTVDAVAGHNIVLTLDVLLQQKAEALLDVRAGAVVALEPDSGRVLAMASRPAFDPNLFVSGLTREQWNDWVTNTYRPLENKAIQGEYPPASVYKIVTAVAGLEEGLVDEHTTYFCPGHYQFGNRAYRCWKRWGHGNVDLIKALAESCDVYFYRLGEALGVDRLAHYAHRMGLGKATGWQVDREARALIPTAQWKLNRFGEPWQRGENLSIAIGQSFNLTTPLQLAVMTAGVANGGTLFKPFVVERMQSSDGQVTYQGAPEMTGRMDLHPETMALLHQSLSAVVNAPGGTARGSRIPSVAYAGKTGTAQVVARPLDDAHLTEERAERHRNHALFVAYAPAEQPRIAVAVVVEHGESGSGAAAPVAKALIETYLGLADD